MHDGDAMVPERDGLDRREVLGALGLGAAGLLGAAGAAHAAIPPSRPDRPMPRPVRIDGNGGGLTPEQLGWDARTGQYTLPPLPYPADALEPHIDAQTMTIHHDKHHKAYVDGMNRALRALEAIRNGEGDASLVKHWSRELAFNGSGHVNHTIFWLTMAPPEAGGGGQPKGDLATAIARDFGSFDAFSSHFRNAAKQVEGSGWGWLVYHPVSDRLMVLQAEKQQNLTIWGVIPLLGVDVWEHAYYLKYQNDRGKYVDAFMNVINWERVGEFYERARELRGS